jgi:hypothetical protein
MRSVRADLTQDALKALLSYDPETGVFIRRKTGEPAGTLLRSGTTTYISISVCGKRWLAHRLAYFYMTGNLPPHQIDHQDGNGLNNAYKNLRAVTQGENAKNRKLNKNNTTGACGISWNRHAKAYRVTISKACVGYYKSFADAVAARAAASEAHGYHQNHGSARCQSPTKPLRA